MSADNFERAFRDQVKARAAELDRTVFPVTSLQTLLASPRPLTRPNVRTSLGLGLAVAGVAVLTIVLVLGSLLLGQRPGGGPLSSVTPSALPSFATPSVSLATASPSLATAFPSPSPTSPSWSPQVTRSEINVGFLRPEADES
jgi:hypothetical protein